MADGFQELTVEALQSSDGIRELNRMLQFLFLKSPASGEDRDITYGYGSPESVVAKNVGSLYMRLDGGATTTLYVKTSGSGATGWTAK